MPSSEKSLHSAQDIQNWLVDRLAKKLKIEPHEIDIHAPFTNFAIDSLEAAAITLDLEMWLGHRLNPELLLENPTVAALAKHLATLEK